MEAFGMRKIQVLFAVLLFGLFAGCGSQYKNGTAEELGESVFLTLKKDDKAGLQGLYPTAADLEKAWEMMDYPEEKRVELRGRVESDLSRMKTAFEESFDLIRARAAAEGIDWATVAWKGVHVEKVNPDGVEVAIITLNLGWKDNLYYVTMKNVGHIGDHWVLANAMEWGRGV